jgi:hypothetical protein
MELAQVVIRGYARTLDDASRALRADQRGDSAGVSAFGLQVIADGVRQLCSAQAEAFRSLFAGKVEDPQEAGRDMQDDLTLAVHACDRVARSLVGRQASPDANAVLAFEEAYARARSLLKEFKRRWPRVDPDEVERGRESVAAGKGVKLEDLARELDHRVCR